MSGSQLLVLMPGFYQFKVVSNYSVYIFFFLFYLSFSPSSPPSDAISHRAAGEGHSCIVFMTTENSLGPNLSHIDY